MTQCWELGRESWEEMGMRELGGTLKREVGWGGGGGLGVGRVFVYHSAMFTYPTYRVSMSPGLRHPGSLPSS